MKKYKNSKIPPILVLGDEKEEELKYNRILFRSRN